MCPAPVASRGEADAGRVGSCLSARLRLRSASGPAFASSLRALERRSDSAPGEVGTSLLSDSSPPAGTAKGEIVRSQLGGTITSIPVAVTSCQGLGDEGTRRMYTMNMSSYNPSSDKQLLSATYPRR